MANFKTHIGWGVFLAVAFLVAGIIFSFISGFEIRVWVFLAILVSSFLPDLDYDGGIPFQILFGLAGAGLSGLSFYHLFQGGEKDPKILIIIPILIFVLVRFGVGYFFQKVTRHRGIFHSIPAAVLAGLLTVWCLKAFTIDFKQELLVGLAILIGYLGHLILDEIYSTVNLNGYSILPKKSLGSAMKLWSSSKLISLIVYFLIIFLISILPEVRSLVLTN